MTASADRLARLRARMSETGTDLVALGPTSHMRWLSGLDPHGDERPVMLLVSQGYVGLLMPSLNAASVRQGTDLPIQEWADAEGSEGALMDLLSACDAIRLDVSVAVDEAMHAAFALRLLDVLPEARRSFAADTVGSLRRRKDESEVADLRSSARLNDAAAAAAFDALEEGMTELDVQRLIHDHYAAHGAAPAFTIVGFGANGAFPPIIAAPRASSATRRC